jgi:hypothetical protein
MLEQAVARRSVVIMHVPGCCRDMNMEAQPGGTTARHWDGLSWLQQPCFVDRTTLPLSKNAVPAHHPAHAWEQSRVGCASLDVVWKKPFRHTCWDSLHLYRTRVHRPLPCCSLFIIILPFIHCCWNKLWRRPDNAACGFSLDEWRRERDRHSARNPIQGLQYNPFICLLANPSHTSVEEKLIWSIPSATSLFSWYHFLESASNAASPKLLLQSFPCPPCVPDIVGTPIQVAWQCVNNTKVIASGMADGQHYREPLRRVGRWRNFPISRLGVFAEDDLPADAPRYSGRSSVWSIRATPALPEVPDAMCGDIKETGGCMWEVGIMITGWLWREALMIPFSEVTFIYLDVWWPIGSDFMMLAFRSWISSVMRSLLIIILKPPPTHGKSDRLSRATLSSSLIITPSLTSVLYFQMEFGGIHRLLL